jgi:hypothetical protein
MQFDKSIEAWRADYSYKASQLPDDKLLHISVPPMHSNHALIGEVESREYWYRPI